jgi:hypothetical protein
MSTAANVSVSTRRNRPPDKAAISVNTASETTSPIGSIKTPNRQTAAAITTSGRTWKRASGSPLLTTERAINVPPSAASRIASSSGKYPGPILPALPKE